MGRGPALGGFVGAGLWLAAAGLAALGGEDGPVAGDAVIRGRAGASEIVISTTTRVAGAIHSLTWGGKEFLDSFDHGRQLQSASNFDCGGTFIPEVFNPTEAGSRADGRGASSSSRLLRIRAEGPALETTSRMAFWLAPGEESSGHPARNRTVLSDHLLSKRLRIGRGASPHAIDYEVTFTLPAGEHHTVAQFEALTAYLPPEFDRFWTFEGDPGTLRPLDDGPGEQASPVVFSTASGSHAMGVYAPERPPRGASGPGYGRFRFGAEKVNKWNCVYRIRDPAGIAPGDYSFHLSVVVGTRDDVRTTIEALREESRRASARGG